MSRVGEERQPYIQTFLPGPVRFWWRVWPRGDCWEFRNGTTAYRRFQPELEMSVLAHRYAFSLVKDLRWDTVIDHTCNHPWYVRPSHLVAADTRENTLRGSGPTAQNARRTHCDEGHLLEPVPWFPTNRRCGICARAKARAKRALLRKPPTNACRKGHPFEGHNLILRKRGTRVARVCRTCRDAYNRSRYAR